MRKFRYIQFLAIFGIVFFGTSILRAEELPLKIFGYFQTEFRYDDDSSVTRKSFLLQQLNLFLQKDLGDNWTSFVNFEILNSYSSLHDWGSLNLEEAWVGYRASDQFKFKIGLQIPEFNNLNTIKNRTPLIPYVVRPVVYETSFGEFINLDFIVPTRAYAQIYGSIPSHGLKIDHAFYLGNSLNMRTGEQIRTRTAAGPAQSGVDTTDTYMVGSRLGMRYSGLKTGFSASHEKFNGFVGLDKILSNFTVNGNYDEMPFTRLGADLSYFWKGFVFESEYIKSKIYRDILNEVRIGAEFYYITIGANVNDQLFIYGSFSQLELDDLGIYVDSSSGTATPYRVDVDVDLPTMGFSYAFSNRITFKGQVLFVDIKEIARDINATTQRYRYNRNLDRFAVAVSAFF